MPSLLYFIKSLHQIICSVFGVTPDQSLSLNSFLTVVGQLKFRGTSVLFRLPRSPVKRGHSESKGSLPSGAVSPTFDRKDIAMGGASKPAETGDLETVIDEAEDMDTSV